MRNVWVLAAVVAAMTVSLVDLTSVALEAASPAAAAQGAAKPVPSSPESIKAGAAIYAKLCRSCHGLRGRGDGIAAPPGTKPANLVDAEWKHGSTDADIFKVIRNGIDPFNAMRPQRGMSDADIWSVIHYLRDLAAASK
jgi:mono/diheme cytochrome c family protein